MSESIGSSGKGMKLHTKILLGLLVGVVLGITVNLTVGTSNPTVETFNATSPCRSARSSCGCCSWS